MIVAVTWMFHDYEPSIIYVDSEKLRADDYVDSQLLKAIEDKEAFVSVDASDWESHPEKFPHGESQDRYGGEVGLTASAVMCGKWNEELEDFDEFEIPEKLDRAIIMRICFE